MWAVFLMGGDVGGSFYHYGEAHAYLSLELQPNHNLPTMVMNAVGLQLLQAITATGPQTSNPKPYAEGLNLDFGAPSPGFFQARGEGDRCHPRRRGGMSAAGLRVWA